MAAGADVEHPLPPLLPGEDVLDFPRLPILRLDVLSLLRQGGTFRQVFFPQILVDHHVELVRDRWPECPTDPFPNVVGRGLVRCGAHVTGGTRGRGRCNPSPQPSWAIHVQLISKRLVQDPVFGLLVHFHLRVVRPKVALAAGVWAAGLLHRESVTCMARRAASPAPVGIDPTDPAVWPGGRIKLPARQDLDFRSVALHAADGHGGGSAHDLSQVIVNGGQDLTALGVVASLLLVDLLLVATAAVLWRDDDGDEKAVVLEGVGVPFLRAVAIKAVDSLLPHPRRPPLVYHRIIHSAVTADAHCPLFRACEGRQGRPALRRDLLGPPERQHGTHQEEQPSCQQHPSFHACLRFCPCRGSCYEIQTLSARSTNRVPTRVSRVDPPAHPSRDAAPRDRSRSQVPAIARARASRTSVVSRIGLKPTAVRIR